MTLYSLKGRCHLGLINLRSEVALIVPILVDSAKFISNFLLTTTEVSAVDCYVVPIFCSYLARLAICPVYFAYLASFKI